VPTFVVTSKMSPALAARVQAAVSGRQQAGDSRKSRLKALFRLLTFVFVVGSALGVVHFRQRRTQQLESLRAELLDQQARDANQLTRADRELPARVTAAIALHTSPSYPGDQLAPELFSDATLTAALAAPTLYLRGPLEALAQSARVNELAESSSKDAFVLCLLAPPDARTEKALRLKASAAYAQGPSMQATAHVERVAPLLLALHLLDQDWRERIQRAETSQALRSLQKLFDAAPLAAAVRSAKARQLLLVLDETSTAKGPTELDGERAHTVRVVLTDLTNGEVRVRFRHDVDPSWLSDNARTQYASGIDSCSLGLDLRKFVSTRVFAR
jgi:hypothetical protein